MRPAPPPDWAPPEASRHAGLFTVRQARAAGMTVEQVRHRRRTGRWVPVAGAALAVAGRPLHPRWTDAHAVALTWPDGVAVLASAARFHGLPVPPEEPVQAWVPHARRAQRGIHPLFYDLRPADVRRVGAVAVTTPVRTVLDCIGRLRPGPAEELLIWALTRGFVDHDRLTATLATDPPMSGNSQRRRLLALTAGGAMGPAERRLHELLRDAGISGWYANRRVRDERGVIGVGDVVFPTERLVIEVDGMAYHGADRFQHDRTRQNRLVAAGWTVLRFTWRDLVDRPEHVAAQVRATLHRLRGAAIR